MLLHASERGANTTMDEFILRALLAGLLVVIVSGPLGCVVVWRRMAYFGDALAHSALLGASVALMIEINPLAGVILTGAMLSYLLVRLQAKRDLSSDAILGILSHGALASGLVLMAVMQSNGQRIDLMAYLFGDILSVSWAYLGWLGLICALVLAVFVWMWQSILALAVSEELARSEGVAVDRVRLVFMLLMAVVIGVAMKIVGIILITALLIVPAAGARRFARSPEAMVVLAIVSGVLSVIGGVFASMQWDTPAGPSIVLVSVLLFFLSRLVGFTERAL
ncbi:Zinc ABC transporter, permease protein ZnuB [hydrothermal vent metagenome]|uniref:High-affinity zinc uptake system membrane protein ZnuB n=1 Tax=hydrothermal vent metagenome TaxID=652676 RepID=A0A3B0XHW5_9ZZZZ